MLPIYRGKFLKPEDVTISFKEKCKEILVFVQAAMDNADKECPFDSESSLNQALRRLREATEIVGRAADNYMYMNDNGKEKLRKGEAE